MKHVYSILQRMNLLKYCREFCEIFDLQSSTIVHIKNVVSLHGQEFDRALYLHDSWNDNFYQAAHILLR